VINPAATLLIGMISGIGGALTYSAYSYVEEISTNGRILPMKTEEERKSFHERVFGEGSTPPAERLGKGETLNDLLPMPPEQGPPLPRALGIKWPGKK
jgi:hypothetical protein